MRTYWCHIGDNLRLLDEIQIIGADHCAVCAEIFIVDFLLFDLWLIGCILRRFTHFLQRLVGSLRHFFTTLTNDIRISKVYSTLESK
ncbi:unnamed protein product [Acanthoscelides obtectus]|uniref:Uncharacterized protein n=1 Tax=Acanthoscelides obtectus TaxID=200917 RepID=A0A9P0KRK3_ACAOB|nr:unnamed protein product [Acanthoscelides obtectus]CAK1665245.1 hypothetical protein AOBTE_LOCUS24728 [Acanthoscelides obtectus]